jgi:hypothetical protein
VHRLIGDESALADDATAGTVYDVRSIERIAV